jgi:hypothetical protein
VPFGDKLWEDTGKASGVTIKSVGPDGVNIEVNYAGEYKGFGTLPDGTFIGTANILQKPNGMNLETDQGVLTTKDGEVVVYKGSGTGKAEGGKSRRLTTYTCMTASQKLGWLNGSILVREGDGDTGLPTFRGTAYEWK